jgi:DNA polymerase-3 subunit delta
MILKNFELDKLENSKNKILLFYGKNEGYKNESILKLVGTNIEYKIYNYTEKEILNYIDEFYSNIYNKSLFEEKKIIIIKGATDLILNIIKDLNENNIVDTIILNSDHLDKKSKLRSFFEKSKSYYSVAFYPDNEQTIIKIIYNFFKKNNIQISNKDISLIANKCNGDRMFLYNELEKIKSYTSGNKKISSSNLSKLINLSEDHDVSEFVDICLAKNKKKALHILNENNFSNEDCIKILRTFLQKSKRLLNLSKDYSQNQNLDLTISTSKPTIFWKDKEIVKQQILNWDINNIKKLIYNLNEYEMLIKKSLNNSVNMVTNFIMSLFSKNN